MRQVLFWIPTGILALLAACFAISNRATTTLAFWPFPGTVDAPLYLVVLGILIVGFLAGRISAWLAYTPLRTAHRRRGRELAELKSAQATQHQEGSAGRSLTGPIAA